MADNASTRVVILGGGFAGVSAAMELSKHRHRRAVEVHLVSDENYFVFQPMLPEVVACSLEASHILNPLRQLCRRLHVHCATVKSVSLTARHVVLSGADQRREVTLPYDHLVFALGLIMDVSRIPGMSHHSLPIKTLGDAFYLRNHVLSRLEQADLENDEQERRRLLTVIAVGGGFSGVETAAEIHDMLRAVMKYYPKAARTGARTVLVHPRERILNELDDGLAHFAQAALRRRGVELLLNRRVREATPEGVLLDDGSFVAGATTICTVGNAPHPLVEKSGLPHQGGRLMTGPGLRVQGCDNVWAVGDAALIPDTARGGYCPPTAQYAVREGRCCAKNILSMIRGRPLRPFEFAGRGQLAIVGRRCGVAQILRWRIAGLAAWWLWRGVYWSKLPGIRCKLRVALDWTLDLVFPRDITKVALDRTQQLDRAHFRAGDTIIRQGEIGDRFYVIESGDVEVLRDQPGRPQERVAVRGAGESFGEIALVRDSLRTATVRCLTPVDVVSFTRRDFQTLLASSRQFRAQIESDVVGRGET